MIKSNRCLYVLSKHNSCKWFFLSTVTSYFFVDSIKQLAVDTNSLCSDCSVVAQSLTESQSLACPVLPRNDENMQPKKKNSNGKNPAVTSHFVLCRLAHINRCMIRFKKKKKNLIRSCVFHSAFTLVFTHLHSQMNLKYRKITFIMNLRPVTVAVSSFFDT